MPRDLTEITLSQQTIRQEVLSQICRSPITAVSALAGILILLGYFFAQLHWGWVIAGIVLVPAGFLFEWIFRAKRISTAFVDKIAKALDRKRQQRLGEIRADLYDLANELSAQDQAGDLASQALEQFSQNHSKFDLFLSVLSRKFDPSELAYARYLSTADKFFSAVMEHLSSTAETLQVVSLTDNDANRVEQLKRVEDLLTQNSNALAAFDATTAAIAAMKDLGASDSQDLLVIKAQLEHLARQAERLNDV